MARTVTMRADTIPAGTHMKVLDRDAEVISVRPLIEHGELGFTGPVRDPKPFYWVELELQWDNTDNAEKAPTFALVIEGNRWVTTRDTGH